MGEKNKQIPLSKYYSETVEDIMSDEERKEEPRTNELSNIDLNDTYIHEIN